MVAFKVLIVLISIYLALEISEAKRLNKNFRRHIVKRQNDGSYGSSSQNGNFGSQQGSNSNQNGNFGSQQGSNGNQNGGNTNSNQNGGNTNNNQTSGTTNNNTKQNGTDSSIYSFFQQLLQSIGYGPTAAPTTTTTTTPGPIVVTNSTQTNATTPRPNSAMLKTVSMGSVVTVTIFGVFFSRFF
uniref:Uncharacterized protein n=1 Tax=Acrobeloides nanus TaxID=290746 RepID=A0A914E0Y9_9BILA